MLGIVLAAAVIVGCSMLVGQGICAIAGRERWAWWAPGVGFAALLVLGGILVRAPGHSKAAGLGIALATLAALVSRPTRAAVRSALPDALPVAGFSLLMAILPFLVSGRAGIIGSGINNDSGAHLGTAWWLQHGRGPAPVGALGGALALVGYPLGPHGIIDAISQNKLALVHTFDGLVVSILPLTALVALGALTGAPRLARWVAAVLVGICYLAASFTMQGSFKETMEGLFIVTAALATRDIVRAIEPAERWRAGLPLGVIAGGSVYAYSYGGLPWTVGVMVAVALAAAPLRRVLTALPGALLAGVVVMAPVIDDITRFAASPFNHEVGDGNLRHAVNPLEGLGVWLNYDFRWTPSPLWPTLLVAAAAGIAAVVAVVRLIRAHDLTLPAALVVPLAICAYAADKKSIYLSAKTLAIAGPIIALTIAGGLLLPAASRARAAVRVPRVALTLVVALAAAASSFLALRDGRVGPEAHAAELAVLKPKLRNGAVLFMPKDDMIQWEMVGLPVFQGRGFYAPLWLPPRPGASLASWGYFDFDSFLPSTLDKFRYVITTRTPFQSLPPSNWRQIAHTRSFILWRRHGRTPNRYGTGFPDRPGRILDCNSEFGRERLAGAGSGFALVRPRPVTGRQVDWRGQPIKAGQSGEMTLEVPRGRWDLSLEYASMTGLKLEAGSLHKTLPATIDRIGPFYYVGTLRQPRSGPLEIRVTAQPLNALGRLLGSAGRTRGLDAPSNLPLNSVALTRHPWAVKRVQPKAACGRWVDYVQPPGRRGTP